MINKQRKGNDWYGKERYQGHRSRKFWLIVFRTSHAVIQSDIKDQCMDNLPHLVLHLFDLIICSALSFYSWPYRNLIISQISLSWKLYTQTFLYLTISSYTSFSFNPCFSSVPNCLNTSSFLNVCHIIFTPLYVCYLNICGLYFFITM